MTYEITKGVQLPVSQRGSSKSQERLTAEKLKPDEGFYAPPGLKDLAGWRAFTANLNRVHPNRTYRAAQIGQRIYVKRVK